MGGCKVVGGLACVLLRGVIGDFAFWLFFEATGGVTYLAPESQKQVLYELKIVGFKNVKLKPELYNFCD